MCVYDHMYICTCSVAEIDTSVCVVRERESILQHSSLAVSGGCYVNWWSLGDGQGDIFDRHRYTST